MPERTEVPQAARSIKISERGVETGAGRLGNGDQQQVQSISSGAPAEALATGQSAPGICPASEKELDPESLREDLRELFPQQQISPPGVEEAILPPQQLDSTPMFIPPAEALATGQSAAGLCPPSELDPGSPRDDLSELFPQHLDTTPVFIPPAEALATGQSSAGPCPALSMFLEGLGDSPCQKSPQWLVTEPAGEKTLPPLQRLYPTFAYVPPGRSAGYRTER